MPRYYGTWKTDSGMYLKLGNCIENPNHTNLLNIWVNSKYENKAMGNKYFHEKHIILNVFKRINKGEVLELRINKYLRVNFDEYKDILKKLFTNYKQKVSRKAIGEILGKLREILKFLEERKFQISFSKLVLGFDRLKSTPLLYFYDFESFKPRFDQSGILAVKCLIEDIGGLIS